MDNTIIQPDEGGVIVYEIVVSSAIIGVAGSGHLCLGYPSTSTFSVPTSPEESTTQLRTYLGACVVQTENILVVPNCFVEGVSAAFIYKNDDPSALKEVPADQDFQKIIGYDASTKKFTTDGKDFKFNSVFPVHPAATFNADNTLKTPNTGPLGNLDRPDGGLGSITAGIVVRKMD